MELEKKLVNYVLEPRFEELPSKMVRLMKDVVLNVFGAIVAGATVPACPEAVQQAIQWGGKAEATILVYGNRVSAPNAAFANGFMARALCSMKPWWADSIPAVPRYPPPLLPRRWRAAAPGRSFLLPL